MIPVLLTVGWILTVAGFLAYLHFSVAPERRELIERIQPPERDVFDPPRPIPHPVKVPVFAGPWGEPDDDGNDD